MLLLRRPATRPAGTARATLGEGLGKLLVSAVFFWAYLAFMQWVIVWSGDLPVEIGWYLVRFNGGWQVMLWLVVALGFSVPFAGLVSRRGKRDPSWLVLIVAATLLGQGLEGVWRIAPAFAPSLPLLALIIATALLFGGAGLAALDWLAARLPAPDAVENAHAAAR